MKAGRDRAASDLFSYVPRAEDAVIIQVCQLDRTAKPGTLFFLNKASHTVQRSYVLVDPGITESVYLYGWGNRAMSEQQAGKIALTLAGHHGALCFFSGEPISDIPINLLS